ncbi:hypothetical protein M2459_000346 [Parabacteroides sp. PF5-5]|uniref:hypothetical protein n=1 Tax=unclassified Parabacteroides TaxID=2649774 RepID=UPI0024734BBD|nr:MULTISPECIES: hypothetical protein [unclassified Parabacteroides]MDH6306359.1 hypothetical protein [Parabacteroides sp. PH5-39]MDH6314631.1 hypothetical protein [Parabacteroides sp. PF5-13]MDH6321070.1 hypothetical protein [Parabacteroides sp. PH5-13]MDH6324802.1 hypothetical protein [Parabacteroides sp. PH5-8]MDH6325517.1 hypothetical protein [Parabacteroides sp. PH5-41]
MKKSYLVLAVLTFTLSFIACGGKTSEKATSEDAAPKTEAAAPAKGNDVLDKYETLVNKTIELYESGKFKSGDAAAMQEYTKIAQEMSEMAEELQEAMQNLTPAQVQKYTELGQKLTDAATKAMN